MVNKKFLSKFKNGSIFVNTARGELQDEIALLNSLENGKLSAVVLDVFSKEPYFNRRCLSMQIKYNGARLRFFTAHWSIKKNEFKFN